MNWWWVVGGVAWVGFIALVLVLIGAVHDMN